MAEMISPLTSIPDSDIVNPAVNPDDFRTVGLTPELSPRAKRKVLLEIANPHPNAAGEVHTRISLYHAERYERRKNADGSPQAIIDRDVNTVAFLTSWPDSDAGDRLMARQHSANGMPDFRAIMGQLKPNQHAIDLWPVIPRYSGRPLEDYLETEARNKPQH
jgi:hypothetical protein